MAAAVTSPPSAAPPRRIAVAGNPNSGKTTVFNALTGLRHKVGNYAGVTVEKREGVLTGSGSLLLDLPGTYSLSARSPDEEVARDVLLGRLPGEGRPDAVLIVLDGSNLERNLYFAAQVLDFGVPAVVCCNMMDVARRRGLIIDCGKLSGELGVPVIGAVANRREGIDAVRTALGDEQFIRPPGRAWKLSETIETAFDRIANEMSSCGAIPAHAVRGAAVLWSVDYLSGGQAGRASAERFLARIPPESAAVIRREADAILADTPDLGAAVVEARYAWIGGVIQRAVREEPRESEYTLSDRIDRIVTHKAIGPVIFAAVMMLLFLSIFSWAEPLMGLIESGQSWLAEQVNTHMAEGALRSLLANGVIGGVGSVVVFFPQICILFLALGILEDSGYMARAAFLMDKLMSRVGLHGKSFIPLLSSYACAIPGIMATRTIQDRRDRLATILVAPLMSCSARLPVYIIIIAAVFGESTWLKAGVMFGLYAVGTAVALGMALFFKRTLLAGPPSSFIMELPPYHLPRPWPILRGTWDRSKLFLTRAGTTIFAVCVIIWALSYYPRMKPAELSGEATARLAAIDPADAEAHSRVMESEQLRHSYIGRLGQVIEPVIRPMGFDWRLGIGILSSFLAREVFVGTMGITFSVGEADESSAELRDRLATATWPDGRLVLTPLAGISLMVFYMLACQCVSTLAVTRRETGGWKWPAFMFAYMTVLACGASIMIYQVGSRMGWGV